MWKLWKVCHNLYLRENWHYLQVGRGDPTQITISRLFTKYFHTKHKQILEIQTDYSLQACIYDPRSTTHNPADIPIDFHFNFARYLLFRSRFWMLYSINIREAGREDCVFKQSFRNVPKVLVKYVGIWAEYVLNWWIIKLYLGTLVLCVSSKQDHNSIPLH